MYIHTYDYKYQMYKLTNLCAQLQHKCRFPLFFLFFVSMSRLHLPKEGLLEPILPSVATVVTPLLFAQALKFSSKDNKD